MRFERTAQGTLMELGLEDVRVGVGSEMLKDSGSARLEFAPGIAGRGQVATRNARHGPV